MEQHYKIQELVTTGWEDIVDENNNYRMTKEECDVQLRKYQGQGISPKRLRAIFVD